MIILTNYSEYLICEEARYLKEDQSSVLVFMPKTIVVTPDNCHRRAKICTYRLGRHDNKL